MPDLDVLIELSDFYEVDFREILNGERKSEHMNEEMKETVIPYQSQCSSTTYTPCTVTTYTSR